MKYCILSTRLKVIVFMMYWIPPMSCSFRLTQHWCVPTRRTNVYRDWFCDSGTKLHSGHSARQNAFAFCSSGYLVLACENRVGFIA